MEEKAKCHPLTRSALMALARKNQKFADVVGERPLTPPSSFLPSPPKSWAGCQEEDPTTPSSAYCPSSISHPLCFPPTPWNVHRSLFCSDPFMCAQTPPIFVRIRWGSLRPYFASVFCVDFVTSRALKSALLSLSFRFFTELRFFQTLCIHRSA